MAASCIHLDPGDLRRYEARLRGIPRALPRVTARALNTAMGPAQTQIKRDASRALGVAQKHVKPRLWPARANAKALRAGMVAGTKGVSAIHAAAREDKSGGVSFRATGARAHVADAFIAEPGGNRHVFRRKGAARYPLELVRTQSPSEALGRGYGDQLVATAHKRFAARMKIETELVLSGRRR